MNCTHSVQFSVIDSVLARLPLNTLLLFNFRGLFPTNYRQSIGRLSYGPASEKNGREIRNIDSVWSSSHFLFFSFFSFSGPLWGRGEGAGCSLSQLHYRLVGGSSPACRVANQTLFGALVAEVEVLGHPQSAVEVPLSKVPTSRKNTFSEEAQYNLKISQDFSALLMVGTTTSYMPNPLNFLSIQYLYVFVVFIVMQLSLFSASSLCGISHTPILAVILF